MNMLNRWQRHAKHCLLKFKGSKSAARGVALSNGVAQPTAFQLQISAASEQHRKKLCDTYVVVYWLYQNNISFNTGPKLKKVQPPPPHTHTHTYTHTTHTYVCLVLFYTRPSFPHVVTKESQLHQKRRRRKNGTFSSYRSKVSSIIYIYIYCPKFVCVEPLRLLLTIIIGMDLKF